MTSENAVNGLQQPWQFASGFVAFTVVVAIIGGAISVRSVILFYWWYFRGRLKVDEGNGRNRDEEVATLASWRRVHPLAAGFLSLSFY